MLKQLQSRAAVLRISSLSETFQFRGFHQSRRLAMDADEFRKAAHAAIEESEILLRSL